MKGLFDELKEIYQEAIEEAESQKRKQQLSRKEKSNDVSFSDILDGLNRGFNNKGNTNQNARKKQEESIEASRQSGFETSRRSSKNNSMFKSKEVKSKKVVKSPSIQSSGKQSSSNVSGKKKPNSEIKGNTLLEQGSILGGMPSEIEQKSGELTPLQAFAKKQEAIERRREEEKRKNTEPQSIEKIERVKTSRAHNLSTVDPVALEIMKGFKGADRLTNAKKAFLYNEIFYRKGKR